MKGYAVTGKAILSFAIQFVSSGLSCKNAKVSAVLGTIARKNAKMQIRLRSHIFIVHKFHKFHKLVRVRKLYIISTDIMELDGRQVRGEFSVNSLFRKNLNKLPIQ